jgi:protein-L-isoaspartate(D-aspartate) O-methyltransferase
MIEDPLTVARRRLLEEIEAEARDTERWTGRSRYSPAVMAAIAEVPRHEFVPGWEVPFSYANRPLGIGHGQTISQPYIVALMTDLLDLTGAERVLEIGTGCGYQAAVLAELAAHVYTLEVIPELAELARKRLLNLGYQNIDVRVGDGYLGWPEEAPFDGIIVTAAPPKLPHALVEQLTPGGRLVVPIGATGDVQMLYRYVREANGTLNGRQVLPVAFVPMVTAPRGR